MIPSLQSTSKPVKYSYVAILAITLVYINHILMSKDISFFLYSLLYLLSAYLFWLMLNYAAQAIIKKNRNYIILIKRIDQFWFITTFGYLGMVLFLGILYFIVIALAPANIAIILTYLVFILFKLLKILSSYNIGRAFYNLKVNSKIHRRLTWMIGSFFLIIYPIVEVLDAIISFDPESRFYARNPWLTYTFFGLDNYILILILLAIKFFNK